jgi:hypothetical protein
MALPNCSVKGALRADDGPEQDLQMTQLKRTVPMTRKETIMRMTILMLIGLLAFVGTAFPSGGKGSGLQALDVQPGSRYKIDFASGLSFEELKSGKRLDVSFTSDQGSATASDIYMTFLFDYTAISVDSIDTCTAHGYYNFQNPTYYSLVKYELHPGSVMVKITGFDPAHFSNTKLFGLWVSGNCIPQATTNWITSPDSNNVPAWTNNHFNLVNIGSVWPYYRDSGYVSVRAYDADMWFTTPTAESTYVSGQVKVPLKFWSNFPPQDSLSATITYDTTHLHYDSVSTVGAWASGLSVYQGHDTITVGKGDNTFSTPTGPSVTVAYLFFTTTNSCELGGQYDLDIQNAYAYACPSYGGPADPGSTHIGIWKYLATYELDHPNVVRSSSSDQLAQLKNNFPVVPLYGEGNNTSGIAFHYLQVTTTHATLLYVVFSQAVNAGTLYWSSFSPDSGKTIKTTNYAGYSDFTLPPSASSYQTIAHIRWYGSNNGTDSTRLETVDSTDCYLKPAPTAAYLLPIRAKGHDNISFESGAVTVYVPNPGCPYLFAWDGARFAEENTIVGHVDNTALAKPSPDFYRLQTRIPLEDGQYRLQIREFEHEQSSFDNFKLTAIDHPVATMVNVTKGGQMSVYRSELFPVSAIDDQGVDCLAAVLDEDGVFFSRQTAGTLTLTYLVGKGLGGESLALTEAPPPPIGQKKLAGEPGGANSPGLMITEVLAGDGSWVRLDALADRANDGTEHVTVDPADYISGGQLVIRKSWETNAYVDKISLLLPSTEESQITDLQLVAATHTLQGDILNQVILPDDDMATLIPGESIELQFADPTGQPVKDGYVRDFVFSANGYYTSYKGSAQVPETYRLSQNYPNPFNPSTTIYYTLVSTTNVDLAVYNMLGQKVKTLVNTMQQAGDQSAVWDGTDDGGSPVASGIYMYKLTTTDYTASRKMILMK